MLALLVPLWLATPVCLQEASDTFEALAAEFDDAVELWIGDQWKATAGGENAPPYPYAEFWPRFEALAEAGAGPAVVWCLKNADAAFAQMCAHESSDAVIREHRNRRSSTIRRLCERVVAAGNAGWVAGSVPSLVELREDLDEKQLAAHLQTLESAGNPVDLRVAAMLGRAAILDAENHVAADDLRIRACILHVQGRELESEEPFASVSPEDLAANAIERLRDAKRLHWRVAFGKTEDEEYFEKAAAPPDPERTYRPMLEALAEAGSCRARIWALSNADLWNADEPTKERLKGFFDAVVRDCASSEDLPYLALSSDALVEGFGADFVEPRVRKLAEIVPDELSPELLYWLGDGLCATAGTDGERQRGLAILRELQERFPETDWAEDAEGKVFYFTNLLVGKLAPDFDAIDVDGNAFKLSDFKGKVTVIDFWGFW